MRKILQTSERLAHLMKDVCPRYLSCGGKTDYLIPVVNMHNWVVSLPTRVPSRVASSSNLWIPPLRHLNSQQKKQKNSKKLQKHNLNTWFQWLIWVVSFTARLPSRVASSGNLWIPPPRHLFYTHTPKQTKIATQQARYCQKKLGSLIPVANHHDWVVSCTTRLLSRVASSSNLWIPPLRHLYSHTHTTKNAEEEIRNCKNKYSSALFNGWYAWLSR